ncbi:hypothetical protein [Neobacillus drentensis]|uniref:hypothetical protein n=1 Tax=Neobacillus drentensis TaxID=220684 RepID=UPI002FFEF9E1
MLKVIVDFLTKLIGAEGASLLREYMGRGDPKGALSAEEAPRTARAWSANQQASLTQLFFKILKLNGLVKRINFI